LIPFVIYIVTAGDFPTNPSNPIPPGRLAEDVADLDIPKYASQTYLSRWRENDMLIP
jgi:hypothetical protein